MLIVLMCMAHFQPVSLPFNKKVDDHYLLQLDALKTEVNLFHEACRQKKSLSDLQKTICPFATGI